MEQKKSIRNFFSGVAGGDHQTAEGVVALMDEHGDQPGKRSSFEEAQVGEGENIDEGGGSDHGEDHRLPACGARRQFGFELRFRTYYKNGR